MMLKVVWSTRSVKVPTRVLKSDFNAADHQVTFDVLSTTEPMDPMMR